VPKIMAAPAYRDGGLIVITFDEGSDSAACCGEASGLRPDHPNVPLPGKNGPGGGRIGAVLLSPLIRPGTISTVDYNHYSLLRTVEDIFGLPHLGDAAMPQVRSFGPDVFGYQTPAGPGTRAPLAELAVVSRPWPAGPPDRDEQHRAPRRPTTSACISSPALPRRTSAPCARTPAQSFSVTPRPQAEETDLLTSRLCGAAFLVEVAQHRRLKTVGT